MQLILRIALVSFVGVSVHGLNKRSLTAEVTPKVPGFVATQTVMGGRGTFSWSLVENNQASRRMLHGEEENDNNNDDDSLVSARLEVDQASGWIGFGVSSDGTMPSTSAVVGFFPTSGLGGFVGEYTLEGYSGFGDRNKQSTMTNVSLVREGNNLILSATFSEIAGKKVNVAGTDTMVFAFNIESSDLNKHSALPIASSISWSDGKSNNDPERIRKIYIAHGSLMITAFCFLYPIGMVPSVFRNKFSGDNTWFLGHRFLQVLGVVCTIVAFVLAVSERVGDSHAAFGTPHTSLGLTLFLVSLFQPFFAIVFRKGKTRPAWRISHFVFAAFLLVGGLANSYIGIADISLGYIGQNAKDGLEIYLYFGFAVTSIIGLLVTWNRIKIAKTSSPRKKVTNREQEQDIGLVDVDDVEDQQNSSDEQVVSQTGETTKNAIPQLA